MANVDRHAGAVSADPLGAFSRGCEGSILALSRTFSPEFRIIIHLFAQFHSWHSLLLYQKKLRWPCVFSSAARVVEGEVPLFLVGVMLSNQDAAAWLNVADYAGA